jgi:hypothetical protein
MEPVFAIAGFIVFAAVANFVATRIQGRDGLRSLDAWARSNHLRLVSATNARVPLKALSPWKLCAVFDVTLKYPEGSTKTGVVTVLWGFSRKNETIEFVPDVTAAEHYKERKKRYWGQW